MDPVKGEDDHHDEIGDEEGDVEGVPAIDVAEGVVGVVGSPVVGQASAGGEEGCERIEVAGQRALRVRKRMAGFYVNFACGFS
jgi:hypothetical protein